MPLACEQSELDQEIATRLQAKGVKASLVWSEDSAAQVGLLDILPVAATKLHAVEVSDASTNVLICKILFFSGG